jgi:membrane protein insertase Oxa1/YidC/SpoIIIJ
MAKYDENRDIKPDTLFHTLSAVGRMGLALLGIIGIAFDFFRDNGWLQKMLNKILDSSLGLTSIPLIIGALYLLNRWVSSSADGKATSRGDLLLYIMMAIGAFFLYRLITTGSL